MPENNTRLIALATLLALISQIFLGGWTSSNYAALMCTSLPVCQGDWVSQLDFAKAFALYQPGHENYEFGVLDYSGRMTIHVSHRFGAIVATLLISILTVLLYRHPEQALKRQSLPLVCLLATQIALGLGNVLLQLPLSIAVMHNLIAALLLAQLVRLNYQLTWRSATTAQAGSSLHKQHNEAQL
jgi:cytochrome c oxidase assembly protein subunit 15